MQCFPVLVIGISLPVTSCTNTLCSGLCGSYKTSEVSTELAALGSPGLIRLLLGQERLEEG